MIELKNITVICQTYLKLDYYKNENFLKKLTK